MTTPAPAQPAEKKPVFDTIVISTPVLLTVVATFILGRSSAEMTQAQYHRSVAGQNQSKVGDQWAFFQAKRIRGTNYETTSALLLAQKADPFTPDTLLDAAQSLLDLVKGTSSQTKPDAGSLREQLKAIQKKAEVLQTDIKAALNPGANGWQGKRTKVTVESLKATLDALERYPDEIQSTGNDSISADQRKLLDEILVDIARFKPEQEIAPKTLGLTVETIDKALEEAKEHTAKVAKRGKDIDRVLEELDILAERHAALVREYQRLLLTKSNATAFAAPGPPNLEPTRALSASVLADYKAARYAFDARRYEEDARSNQKAAYLYDVQVLRASARSDKHLQRSFYFMLAMLIAQIGVTIASTAMAMRRKLPLWGVAALSGFVSILFGVYVLLELGPLW